MNREEIMALELPTQDVDVPGVGSFRIRALSALEALEYTMSPAGVVENMSLLLARSIIGDDGRRLFKDDEATVLTSKLSAPALEVLSTAMLTLSGLADEPEEEGDDQLSFDEAQSESNSSD